MEPNHINDLSRAKKFLSDINSDFKSNWIFLNNVIRSLNIAVYIHDLNKMRHIWTNHNYYKIIGYSDSEIKKIGPDWAERNYHPDDISIMPERINYFKKNKGDTFSGIYRIKHKKGHWVWVYSNTIVYKRDKNNRPEQLLGICIDFSDNFKTMKQFSELYRENQQLKNQLLITNLTKREKEIIKMIAGGMTSGEIAAALSISLHTANNHRKNILKKLDFHNKADIARFAVENGLD
jgi:PAS domain S-box-containing protein